MTTPWQDQVRKALIASDAPHVVTAQDLKSYALVAAGNAPPPASFVRWVRRQTDNGALQPVTRGVYLNRLAGPIVHPAEAAQYIRRGAIVSLAWVLERSGALNNFGDTVTCVVPQVSGMAPPKVGERSTIAAPFRFYAMPRAILESGAANIGDVQDLAHAYPRATPERALLDWIYLGRSKRSRLPMPPFDIQLGGMSIARLNRVAKAMGVDDAWRQWHVEWKRHAAADDVRENSSAGLGF